MRFSLHGAVFAPIPARSVHCRSMLLESPNRVGGEGVGLLVRFPLLQVWGGLNEQMGLLGAAETDDWLRGDEGSFIRPASWCSYQAFRNGLSDLTTSDAVTRCYR